MPDTNDQKRSLQDLLNTMNDFSTTMAATMDMMNEKSRQFIEVSDKLIEKWGTMADDAKSLVAHVDQMEKGFSDILRMVGRLKSGIINHREVRLVRDDFEKIAKAAKQILDDEGRTTSERHRARQTLDAMTRSLEKIRDITSITPQLAGELKKELEGVEGTLSSIRKELERSRSAFDAVGAALRDTFGNVRMFEPFNRFFDKYRRIKETGEATKRTAQENIKRSVAGYQARAAKRENPLQDLLHRIPVTPEGKIDKKALQSMKAEQRAEIVRSAQEVRELDPTVLGEMVEKFSGTPKNRQKLAQGIREAADRLVREGGPLPPVGPPPGMGPGTGGEAAGGVAGRAARAVIDAAQASETAGEAAEAAATGATTVAETVAPVAAEAVGALTGEGLGGVASLATAGTGGEAAAAAAGGTAAVAALPVAAIASVLVALKEAFDGMAEDNQKIFASLAQGGMGPAGAVGFQNVRDLLRLHPGDTGFKYGQTEEKSRQMGEIINKFGVGTAELWKKYPTGPMALKDTFLGEAGRGGIAQVAFGPGMLAGLNTTQATEETMKLITQYGKSVESVHNFFVMLDDDIDATGISTSKYLEIIDDINGHFTLLTKNLEDVTQVLRNLGQTGMFTGQALKEFSQAFMAPKGAPLPWQAYLVSSAPPEMKTGMLRGFQADARDAASDVYSNLVSALMQTGMEEPAARAELAKTYQIRSAEEIPGKQASLGVIIDAISSRVGEGKGREFTSLAGTALDKLGTASMQRIKAERAFSPKGTMEDILDLFSGPVGPNTQLYINLENAVKAVTLSGMVKNEQGKPASFEEVYRKFVAPRPGEEKVTNQLVTAQLAAHGNMTTEEIMRLAGKPKGMADTLVSLAAQGKLPEDLKPKYLKEIAQHMHKESPKTSNIDTSGMETVDGLKRVEKEVKEGLGDNWDLQGKVGGDIAEKVGFLSDIADRDSDLSKSSSKSAKVRGEERQKQALETSVSQRTTNQWLEAIFEVLMNRIYWLLSHTLGTALGALGVNEPEMVLDTDTGSVVPKAQAGPNWKPLDEGFNIAPDVGIGAGSTPPGWTPPENAGLLGYSPGTPGTLPGLPNALDSLSTIGAEIGNAVYQALWPHSLNLLLGVRGQGLPPAARPGGIPSGPAATATAAGGKDSGKTVNVDVKNYNTKTDYHMSDLRTPNGSDIGTSKEYTPDKAKKLAIDLSNAAIDQASHVGTGLPSGWSPATHH